MPRVVAEEWPAADGRFWPAHKPYAGTRRGRALIGPALRRPAKPEAYAMRAAGRSLAGVWDATKAYDPGRRSPSRTKVSLLGYTALLKIHALLYRGTYATNPMDTPQASKQVNSSKHQRSSKPNAAKTCARPDPTLTRALTKAEGQRVHTGTRRLFGASPESRRPRGDSRSML